VLGDSLITSTSTGTTTTTEETTTTTAPPLPPSTTTVPSNDVFSGTSTVPPGSSVIVMGSVQITVPVTISANVTVTGELSYVPSSSFLLSRLSFVRCATGNVTVSSPLHLGVGGVLTIQGFCLAMCLCLCLCSFCVLLCCCVVVIPYPLFLQEIWLLMHHLQSRTRFLVFLLIFLTF
jgi:hypothetical protein